MGGQRAGVQVHGRLVQLPSISVHCIIFHYFDVPQTAKLKDKSIVGWARLYSRSPYDILTEVFPE